MVARKWRNIALSHQTHSSDIQKINRETIEELCDQGLLRARAHVNQIVREWLFPLYPLDLRRKIVDPASLRDIQAQWSPEL